MAKQIYITAQDRQRLLNCLAVLQDFPDKRDLPYIQYLDAEVQRAQVILDPVELPADVITMRSTARLQVSPAGTSAEYTLVYPGERRTEEGCVSVLAPLGAAMLGHKVGDTFEVELPKGPVQFLVEAIIYQPEAAGDIDL
jgi:regulator of nucleoside diphosphate kinase